MKRSGDLFNNNNTKFVRGRWRKVINAVRFSIKMERIREDQRWGSYVQSYTDRLLLECVDQSVPDSYFRSMPTTALPPGWVLRSLHEPIRRQIETFAKNKLVRLFLPRARLQATKANRQREVARATSTHAATISTPDCLARHSVFFASWSRSALEQLVQGSRVKIFPQGHWLTPCSKEPFFHTNVYFILEGNVQTFESLTAFRRYAHIMGIATEQHADITVTRPDDTAGDLQTTMTMVNLSAASGGLTTPTAPQLSHQSSNLYASARRSAADVGHGILDADKASEGMTSRISRVSAADSSLSPPVRSAKEVVDATRAILQTPVRKGHYAKTKATVLEVPFALIRNLVAKQLSEAGPSSPLRGFLHSSYLAQMEDYFPLRPSMLQQPHEYFHHWDAADVMSMVSAAKLCVAFAGESLLTSAVGDQLAEFVILMRGEATLSDMGSHKNPSRAIGSLALSGGDTFGEDFVVFDDPCHFTLTAASSVVEYCSIPRQALVANLKSTNSRRAEYEHAQIKRERLLSHLRPTALLGSLLRTHNLFRPLGNRVIHDIAEAMQPCVVKVADRLTTTGDDMAMLFVMVRGKLNMMVFGSDEGQSAHAGSGLDTASEIKHSYANECLVGENYLSRNAKWKASYSAARLCEGWVITRFQTWAILRAHGVASAVGGAMRQRSGSLAKPSQHDQRRIVSDNPSSPRRPTAPHGITGMAATARPAGRYLAERATARSERLATVAEELRSSRHYRPHTAKARSPSPRHTIKPSERGNESVGAGKSIERASKLLYDLARSDRLKSRLAPKPPPNATNAFTAEVNHTPKRPPSQATQKAVDHSRSHVLITASGGLDLMPPTRRRGRTAEATGGGDVATPTSTLPGRIEYHLRQQQRKAMADASAAILDADQTSSDPHSGRAAPNSAAPPSIFVTRAEKAVLKEVVAVHKDRVKEHRRIQSELENPDHARRANPYSSLHRRAEPVPRVTQFGRLYYDSASGSPRQGDAAGHGAPRPPHAFVPSKAVKMVPTSYLSVHAFTANV